MLILEQLSRSIEITKKDEHLHLRASIDVQNQSTMDVQIIPEEDQTLIEALKLSDPALV